MTVDTVDPSGASGVFVVSVKGALLVLAVAALVIVLRERPQLPPDPQSPPTLSRFRRSPHW
jgi:hypothetical protein